MSNAPEAATQEALPESLAAALEPLLAQAALKYEVEFEPLMVDGSPLHILQIRNMRAHLDALVAKGKLVDPLRELPLWAKIWPASFVLGRYLRKFEPAGKRMLELGAGCGVTGLVASRYGFGHVTLSDINDDALLFARINVMRNQLEDRVAVKRVDIASTRLDEKFDIISASEVLYIEELHRPLLKFLLRHLNTAAGGKAVICTDTRRKRSRFFKQAEKDFRVSEQMVGIRSTGDDGEEERRVFTIHTLEPKHP